MLNLVWNPHDKTFEAASECRFLKIESSLLYCRALRNMWRLVGPTTTCVHLGCFGFLESDPTHSMLSHMRAAGSKFDRPSHLAKFGVFTQPLIEIKQVLQAAQPLLVVKSMHGRMKNRKSKSTLRCWGSFARGEGKMAV